MSYIESKNFVRQTSIAGLGLGLYANMILDPISHSIPIVLPLIIDTGLLSAPLGQLILKAAVLIHFDRDPQKSAPL